MKNILLRFRKARKNTNFPKAFIVLISALTSKKTLFYLWLKLLLLMLRIFETEKSVFLLVSIFLNWSDFNKWFEPHFFAWLKSRYARSYPKPAVHLVGDFQAQKFSINKSETPSWKPHFPACHARKAVYCTYSFFVSFRLANSFYHSQCYDWMRNNDPGNKS